MMGTEEGEEPQISGIDQPFKRITEEKFPESRKNTPNAGWTRPEKKLFTA